jgi:hypothetical protein
MKRRKNLFLSAKAIARGEEIAAETGKSLSAVVEEQLLTSPSPTVEPEEFWPAPALKPIKRANDPRYHYLKQKQG